MTTRDSPALMPSVMCSDFRSMERDMAFYTAHFSHLHVDVCDGHYCPNLAAGPDLVNALRRMAPIGMDYHLMVERPEEILELFDIRMGDQVSIQLETLRAPARTLRMLRERGAAAFLALAPATPLSALEYLWPGLDGLTLMMIEPGYGKQNAQPEMLRKLVDARREKERRGLAGLRLQADGNVSAQNAPEMARNGAEQLVLGTSALYTGGAIDPGKFERMRAAVAAAQGG